MRDNKKYKLSKLKEGDMMSRKASLDGQDAARYIQRYVNAEKGARKQACKPYFVVSPCSSGKGFSLLQWDFRPTRTFRETGLVLPYRSLQIETDLAELFCKAANDYFGKESHD